MCSDGPQVQTGTFIPILAAPAISIFLILRTIHIVFIAYVQYYVYSIYYTSVAAGEINI